MKKQRILTPPQGYIANAEQFFVKVIVCIGADVQVYTYFVDWMFQIQLWHITTELREAQCVSRHRTLLHPCVFKLP